MIYLKKIYLLKIYLFKIYLKKIYLKKYIFKICLVLVAAASPRPQEMFRAGNVRFWEKNDFQKMTLFFWKNIKIIFSKNHTRRSAIKFCVDPIFVGSELIGNRTSYDQNTFYMYCIYSTCTVYTVLNKYIF